MKRTVKKPVERRADIIDAARYLFQTKEYEKTTMQDVMEKLDIAKGTIYHYFPSKEALLEAVVEDMVNGNIEFMQTRIQQAQGNALHKMKVLIESGNMAASNEGVLDALHKDGNAALHTRLLAVTILKIAPLYAEVIQLGCDEGIFQTDVPLESAEFILSGVQFLIDTGIYSWQQDELNRRIKAIPRLIEQQLKAPKGSFEFMTKLFNL